MNQLKKIGGGMTEASQDRDKDEFYEQLNEVINEAPSYDLK